MWIVTDLENLAVVDWCIFVITRELKTYIFYVLHSWHMLYVSMPEVSHSETQYNVCAYKTTCTYYDAN